MGYFDEDDDNGSDDENEETTSKVSSTEKPKQNFKSAPKEENSIPVILNEMDKKTLMSVIETLELEVDNVKITTPPSKIRQIIKDKMIEVYELEGSDEEINESIVNIINDSLNSNDSDDLNEYQGEEEEGYQEEEDNEENFQEEEKEEEKEEKPASTGRRKSSLMDKYKKKS